MAYPEALRRVGIPLMALLFTACSHRDIYNQIQTNRLDACERNPPAAAEACRQDFDVPYDDYRRTLEDIDNTTRIEAVILDERLLERRGLEATRATLLVRGIEGDAAVVSGPSCHPKGPAPRTAECGTLLVSQAGQEARHMPEGPENLSAEKDAEIGREAYLRLHRLTERLARRHGIAPERASDFILTGSLFLTANLNDCDLASALALAQELTRSVLEDDLPEETRH